MLGVQATSLEELWSELVSTSDWERVWQLVECIREITFAAGADLSTIDTTSIFAPLVLPTEQLRKFADFLEGKQDAFSAEEIQKMGPIVRRKRGRDPRSSNLGGRWRMAENLPEVAKFSFEQLFPAASGCH